MLFHTTIFTLFPEAFPGTLGISIHGKALEEGIWSLETIDLRPFGEGRHLKVDDTPAGGGAGMVMKADVLIKAFDAHIAPNDPRPRFLMSPRGEVLTQGMVRAFVCHPDPALDAGEGSPAIGAPLQGDPSTTLRSAQDDNKGIILICGRYEGVDQRFLDLRNIQELSIGDYVLSGGEVAAQVVLEAVIRLLPGVMGKAISGIEESHSAGLLEYPHYTRPVEIEGARIPDVLLNGDHKKIAEWRLEQSKTLTKSRRPDLWKKYENNA